MSGDWRIEVGTLGEMTDPARQNLVAFVGSASLYLAARTGGSAGGWIRRTFLVKLVKMEAGNRAGGV